MIHLIVKPVVELFLSFLKSISLLGLVFLFVQYGLGIDVAGMVYEAVLQGIVEEVKPW
ncbi:hypothetical protein HTZ84_04920 [Haloterrigena sp. SYSU A558-1]|uniref:Uncharacterized protein n=1 Tax=Haloterrigena gelatinilytica TaxID=2741724 RepID=A0ABX2LBE3_9EURY|nr:hypothetical protein [Haloterrigena gelatinilytica]NUC71658.1 hypothetical protein [Haloterrigena gelatinilytica]